MLYYILIVILIAIIAILIFVLSYTGYQLGWYSSLEKPRNYYYTWIYSPIWFIIYGILIYTWSICRKSPLTSGGITLIYLLQMVLLLLYVIFYFYYRSPEKSIPFLIASIIILMAIMLLFIYDPISVMLLSLYLIWLLYLLYSTWQIVIINPIN